jgi:hypothetical protein
MSTCKHSLEWLKSWSVEQDPPRKDIHSRIKAALQLQIGNFSKCFTRNCTGEAPNFLI